MQNRLFGVTLRSRVVTDQIQSIKERLKDELYLFIEKFWIEVLVPENILATPMHVALGLAMTEVIVETTLPVIAHHHDFVWERERFTLNAVNDYALGVKHFSYAVARRKLAARLANLFGEGV